MTALHLEPLTPAGLDTFAELLGASCFGGCFCAVWTSHDDTWAARCAYPSRPNLALTRAAVLAGRRAGYFVHADGALAGWIGAGPRTEFPLLEQKLGSRLGTHDAQTWAIGCLSFLPRFRGAGLAAHAVTDTIKLARDAGATHVEAYPTRPWDEPRSYRGAHTMYARLGFEIRSTDRDGDAEILLMSLAVSQPA